MVFKRKNIYFAKTRYNVGCQISAKTKIVDLQNSERPFNVYLRLTITFSAGAGRGTVPSITHKGNVINQ